MPFAINTMTIAAALGFAAPLFILVSLWYARDTVGVSDEELPIFKTGLPIFEADVDRPCPPRIPPMRCTTKGPEPMRESVTVAYASPRAANERPTHRELPRVASVASPDPNGSPTSDDARGTARAHHLIVVGDERDRKTARGRLIDVDAALIELDWHEDVLEHVGPGVVGIVVAGTPPVAEAPRFVRTLHDTLVDADRVAPPVVVLHPEEIGDRIAREIYEAGAACVAPLARLDTRGGEVSLHEFRGLVPRTLANCAAAGAPSSVDDALARQARIRLTLASPRYVRLHVAVEDGLADVRGELTILWRRVHAERIVRSTPGITDALVKDVRIGTRRSDALIDERIAQIVEKTIHATPAVTWSVDHGLVVFAGAVKSRLDLEELIGETRRIPGVRRIENDLVVSPKQTARDIVTARRIDHRLDELGIDDPVETGVVGHFAFLRGEVRDEGRRALVRRAVAATPGIDRVVDELDVAAAR